MSRGMGADLRPGQRPGTASAAPAVVCEGVTHAYRDAAGTEVTALDAVDLTVRAGEAVALVGPSGAGKSTLLTMLAGLARPDQGSIRVNDHEITRMPEGAVRRLRARHLGMVLQTPGRNVLPYATAGENVIFAQRSRRGSRADRRAEVDELLATVGLAEHRDRPARFLSGGQQQRLAVAVALAGQPAVLLADEPTSQLDRRTGDAVVELMLKVREERGTTLVVVTHDHHLSDALDAAYTIHDGTLKAGSWSPATDGEDR
jgi:putative ABC transport system ATP-binding protein